MKKLLLIVVPSLLLGTLIFRKYVSLTQISGAPPYQTADDPPDMTDGYTWLRDWQRPSGPAKVALQAGHLKNEEVPEELEGLRGNTGATGGGKSESEVNLAIANATAAILALYPLVKERIIETENIVVLNSLPKERGEITKKLGKNGRTDALSKKGRRTFSQAF